MQIRKLAILWNAEKDGAEICARSVADAAKKLGAEVVLTSGHPVPVSFLENADACCVIGGDGTILGAVESAAENGVPIFGINRGKLGYLANYAAEDLPQCVKDVFAGRFRRVPHRLLECRLANDTAGTRRLALNDVVIKAWENFKMTALRVDSRDYGHVNTYHGDGLILTTSTGSTAYSLGAGGPLIHSDAEVFALNPICPHTLSNRTLVLPKSMEIEIRNESPSVPVGISIDGRTPLAGESAFPLRIRLSDTRLDILQPEGLSEFDILRKKLRWV
ncbi:MAG: NAD(+)/NADH kinase [Opitutales bacterium]|nr:NAD(+)/NADH kinase [Opitutales bacterium]